MKLPSRLVALAVAATLNFIASARAEIKLSASEPVLLTSAGQSADVQILKTLFDRSKVTAKTLPLAKPSDLDGVKTLVIAVGGSSKGLGAAGIDAAKETARLKSLLAKARELKIPVLAMHIGGESAKTVTTERVSKAGSQLESWRMRSGLLYYRKHHGTLVTWGVAALESLWHRLRSAVNAGNAAKQADSRRQVGLIRQAWADTAGGALCPPRPW